jgi:hypothetical protein
LDYCADRNCYEIILTSKEIDTIMIFVDNINVLAIQTRIEAVLPTLNEYQRRRYLSAEAKTLRYGGISLISRISGMSRQTLLYMDLDNKVDLVCFDYDNQFFSLLERIGEIVEVG